MRSLKTRNESDEPELDSQQLQQEATLKFDQTKFLLLSSV